jgi:hypothetical protein
MQLLPSRQKRRDGGDADASSHLAHLDAAPRIWHNSIDKRWEGSRTINAIQKAHRRSRCARSMDEVLAME